MRNVVKGGLGLGTRECHSNVALFVRAAPPGADSVNFRELSKIKVGENLSGPELRQQPLQRSHVIEIIWNS